MTRSSNQLPLLPLRDIVVFPQMMVPLYVGRSKSIHAVDEAMRGHRDIVLAAQIKAKTNEPIPAEIYSVGCISQIMQHIKRPDGTVKILVEGRKRCRIKSYVDTDDAYIVDIVPLDEIIDGSSESLALQRTIKEIFENYAKLSKRLQPDVVSSIQAIENPCRLADTIIAHLPIKHPDKQTMLEMIDSRERMEKLYELMQAEIEILQVERKIRTRVKKQMERSEKEYYLNEQMRAIQKELGDRDEQKGEMGELEDKLQAKKMPDLAREKVDKELKKLKMMSPMSAEASVVRNYLECCLSLPWLNYSQDRIDLDQAEAMLDEDHYSLEKPKERILEHLAVMKLANKVRGPILCLVGPPGVGKTSLARSIARAMGRSFVRISLGGVRDEAEIRGHRRTYIGAMPGKIIESLKKAGTSNPVVLLDEIDKMSTDFRGDPSAALLEVLDPEQNTTFSDHYLDLDYDLSKVLFLCTANSTQGIPEPLQDRLEIIRIAGYTELEKMVIAKRYLIPKQREETGLDKVDIHWQDSAIKSIIQCYTREAGVRKLDREIASVFRKVAKEVVKDNSADKKFKIAPNHIRRSLGVPKYQHNKREEHSEIGVATGLAWTSMGGEILQIEVTTMPGKGKLTITGKLGDVMQESAQAAMSYVRSRAAAWGLSPQFYQDIDIHVHVPEGATPKDGPSAGITMATALVSALTKIPVRPTIAMTGEITLRGRVLPIGGLKEKSLAAHRADIFNVIIPIENKKDLEDIPPEISKVMKFYPVEYMDQVLELALDFGDHPRFTIQTRPETQETATPNDEPAH